ncbi:hypothetical protein [Actinacidiphila oryziradicis]|uniref:Uncharacterized protein n=1 Tax=Actinacidiphila oryziradicis TaxID=2571141 RepID=A0A4U0SP18_9ACTN|nr:hypothetical protein [Actinacidiphila oryziradicis]TKA11780.1 hypothetical protein FCI23_10675 [Actinacidiphila oryziradicis]
MNQASQAIMAALDDPDPRRPFTLVKDLIGRQLRRMDPRAEVIPTGFFNHTYAPDMVIRWPQVARTPDRYVYLRTTANPAELHEDITRLQSKDRPMILSLGEIEASASELQPAATEHQALLLDTPAFGELLPTQDTPSIPRLISSSVIEGGRGAFDGPSTARFTNTVATGVAAAREGSAGLTRTALDAVAAQMVPEVADRMTAFMAALWQGGGATLASFPGTLRGSGQLDESTLAYLLSAEEIPDTNFWDRLLRLISLPLLLRTPVRDPDNLQHLMRPAVRHWQSHACKIVPGAPPHAPIGPWRWAVDSGHLVLQTPRFRTYVAQTRKDLEAAETYDEPGLDDVRNRADRFSTPLTSIRMLVTNRRIGYDGRGDNVVHDAQLDGISEALGQAETVIEVDAPTRSGAVLRCSFTHHLASARGARSQVPLDELIGTAARLLYDLTDHEADQLAGLLGPQGQPVSAPWNQPPLFEP